jgi:hypothetical protein
MTNTELETVRQMAINWGYAQPVTGRSYLTCPPEARFITGKPDIDALIYYFESESGLQLKLSPDFNTIIGYDIINHEKFVWFVLRWS